MIRGSKKVMKKIISLLLVLWSSTNLFGELSICEFKLLEDIIYNWDKKINFFCYLSCEFEDILNKKNIYLKKKKCFFKEIEDFACEQCSPICISTANYRLYRWLIINHKKMHLLLKYICKEHKFYNLQKEFAALDDKLQWLDLKINELKNEDSIYCRIKIYDTNCLIEQMKQLGVRIKQANEKFFALNEFYNNLEAEIKELQDLILKRIDCLEVRCCCWF